ncbi:magnesium transporter [Rhodococcus sp. SRB_17]|uniref:magnesium and cobalt transport protein CorA n=1 Tax=Rhodococcus sp. OK302 TaxID=1882769 RepID=UPI000B93A74F|nr:magnesium and cobalt transport protein CorA [Rhodococcus sp. OK302]NMM83403.1 magnesium transporter [Rhodococcus sp. SRB_17]OYD71496.1 magnesium transporter [Rhodococcus sp. OK302]
MPSLPSWPNGKSRQTPTPRIPIPAARAIVDCAVYVEGARLPGKYTHSAALAEVRKRGDGFVWVGMHAPDEHQMQDVAETFGLHELMVEDAVHAHQRPKLERYDDVMFLVLRTVVYVPHESVETANEIVETGEIMVFVGPDFVVTVRHGDHSELASVRRSLEQVPERLAMGPWSVLHAITDHVVDTYLSVTQLVEQDVDGMEELVFSPQNSVAVEHIYLLKREIVELRRSVTPLGLPLLQLTQPAGGLVPKEIRRYFRDVRDHHTNVSERISEYDEVLSSLVDAALAKIAVQQNTDMRKISSWVAIAAVPTGIAGIYGMNFENMPELSSQYGYPMVLAFIASVCVGLFFLFRRNNWL